MGKGVKEKIAQSRLRRSQNEILANSAQSEWYWEVDRDTGVKKKRRRRIIIKHKK